MGDTLRPFVGDRVLEIGAGIGALTAQLIPRDFYVASDINPHYLHYLCSYAVGKPYLRVARVDAGHPEDFSLLKEAFDTVLMVNVLEHVPDEQIALENVHAALKARGRAVILVPQHPGLYGSLDVALEHRERYSAQKLRAALERSVRCRTDLRLQPCFCASVVPQREDPEADGLLANSIEDPRVGHASRPEAGSRLAMEGP
jgi:2-polyprenyl-3-methyl-5-hydroxy-6-metoxy-1,4-benzoquinol methylase